MSASTPIKWECTILSVNLMTRDTESGALGTISNSVPQGQLYRNGHLGSKRRRPVRLL